LLAHGAYAMGSGNSGSSNSSSGEQTSYSEAERAVQAGEYREAIGLLNRVVAEDGDNVDAYNYLGYSHRKLGEYDQALRYYRRALELDADHRGANEYLGQLYLQQDNLDGAEQQLARLEQICGSGCEEADSLREAIARYRANN
jgi:Flp pilus assembly protein TadD